MNTTQGTDAWEKREAFIMTTTNKTSLKDKYVALIHAATEADDLIMIEVTLKNFVDYINSVIMMVFGAEIIKERYAPDAKRGNKPSNKVFGRFDGTGRNWRRIFC